MGASGNDGQLQSEINVTPLVDVVLVLLIIFMVIVPLTMRGYDVDIPGPAMTVTEQEESLEQVVLGIDLGKNSCSLAGLDTTGAVVLRRRMTREVLIAFVGPPHAPPGLGSQVSRWLAAPAIQRITHRFAPPNPGAFAPSPAMMNGTCPISG